MKRVFVFTLLLALFANVFAMERESINQLLGMPIEIWTKIFLLVHKQDGEAGLQRLSMVSKGWQQVVSEHRERLIVKWKNVLDDKDYKKVQRAIKEAWVANISATFTYTDQRVMGVSPAKTFTYTDQRVMGVSPAKEKTLNFTFTIPSLLTALDVRRVVARKIKEHFEGVGKKKTICTHFFDLLNDPKNFKLSFGEERVWLDDEPLSLFIDKDQSGFAIKVILPAGKIIDRIKKPFYQLNTKFFERITKKMAGKVDDEGKSFLFGISYLQNVDFYFRKRILRNIIKILHGKEVSFDAKYDNSDDISVSLIGKLLDFSYYPSGIFLAATLIDFGANPNPEHFGKALLESLDKDFYEGKTVYDVPYYLVKLFSAKYAELSEEDKVYKLCFMAKYGMENSLKKFLEGTGVNDAQKELVINKDDSDGKNALYYAIENNWIAIVQKLLEHGAKIPPVKSTWLKTSIIELVLEKGYFDLVKDLLKGKEKTLFSPLLLHLSNKSDYEGVSYFFDMVSEQDKAHIKKNLLNSFFTRIGDIRGKNLILEFKRLLSVLGEDVVLDKNFGLLFRAIEKVDSELNIQERDVVSYLLYLGADYKAKNAQGETVLEFAIAKGDEQLIKQMLDFIEQDDPVYFQAIKTEGVKGSATDFRANIELIEREIKMKSGKALPQDTQGALEKIMFGGMGKALDRYLTTKSVDQSTKDELLIFTIKSFIHNMSISKLRKSDVLRCINRLLISGANIEHKDDDDWTPLMWAIRTKRARLMRVLLENGAKIDVRTMDDWTPLTSALTDPNFDEYVVRALVDHGAKLDFLTKSGKKPMNIAGGKGKIILQSLQQALKKADQAASLAEKRNVYSDNFLLKHLSELDASSYHAGWIDCLVRACKLSFSRLIIGRRPDDLVNYVLEFDSKVTIEKRDELSRVIVSVLKQDYVSISIIHSLLKYGAKPGSEAIALLNQKIADLEIGQGSNLHSIKNMFLLHQEESAFKEKQKSKRAQEKPNSGEDGYVSFDIEESFDEPAQSLKLLKKRLSLLAGQLTLLVGGQLN